MEELPTIMPGHPPMDVCHKTHSGVAIHVMPGCECAGPTHVVAAVKDKDGNVIIPEHHVRGVNHVTVHKGPDGQREAISIEQARNAGYIT